MVAPFADRQTTAIRTALPFAFEAILNCPILNGAWMMRHNVARETAWIVMIIAAHDAALEVVGGDFPGHLIASNKLLFFIVLMFVSGKFFLSFHIELHFFTDNSLICIRFFTVAANLCSRVEFFLVIFGLF
ncbi:hypothetical protein E6O75_ATG02192 [Venturia nashicola]|uniref:Uncharacterized protein n=1 Tax=Venturia nashicola TaxID=86259 RepID=A0A4Z1P5V8_9PEZI|nr:hypothetical protein E6O75_ATG02192 [Venturia nashicola]